MRALRDRALLLLAWIPVLVAQPQLRLELGFHTSAIKALVVDSAERFLVTASDDKTVRVWDVASGRLLNVLRPPIGDIDEGKMYAAAITPDGKGIAAGGWTGPETHSIYIFDSQSGRMLHRLPDLRGVTLHLAFSPDGRYLMAALDGGVRLYRTSDYSLAAEDTGYKGNVNWSAFSPAFAKDGLVVTGAQDLYVRVYRVSSSGRLLLLRRRISSRKEEPVNIAFSPDAAKLAIAFNYDAYPVVEVWDSHSLARLYKVDSDTLGGSGGSAERVAWSADGNYLYAAGGIGFARSKIVRVNQGGRGDAEEVETGTDTSASHIAEILPLRNGALLFATGLPALGMVDANWKVARFLAAPIPGYLGLDLNKKFLLSQDGMSLRFSYQQQGADPAWFSVARRLLAAGESPSGFTGKPPDDESLEVILNRTQVQLNRKLLVLLDGEVGNAVADVPGGRQFVLATQWRLILFDGQGQEQWQISLPSSAEAVNVSGDGKLAVAALRDGIIHWYRVKDGKELLAFFPHPDRKRWILWTPEGYYDCSPGAEELFGLHINRGPDQAADFEPAAKSRSKYNRPDLVTGALR